MKPFDTLQRLSQHCRQRLQDWRQGRAQAQRRQAAIDLAMERAALRPVQFADTQFEIYRSEAFAEDLHSGWSTPRNTRQSEQLLRELRRASAGIMRPASRQARAERSSARPSPFENTHP